MMEGFRQRKISGGMEKGSDAIEMRSAFRREERDERTEERATKTEKCM